MLFCGGVGWCKSDIFVWWLFGAPMAIICHWFV